MKINVSACKKIAEEYCNLNGLDYSQISSAHWGKTIDGEFIYFCIEKKIVPDGLKNDLETQPYVVLICDEIGNIKETEYTDMLR